MKVVVGMAKAAKEVILPPKKGRFLPALDLAQFFLVTT